MNIVRTHTRVHVAVEFANPHLICDPDSGGCGKPVTGYHDPALCGCEDDFWNEPCEDSPAGVVSLCPSWGPVDGCTCELRHDPLRTPLTIKMGHR